MPATPSVLSSTTLVEVALDPASGVVTKRPRTGTFSPEFVARATELLAIVHPNLVRITSVDSQRLTMEYVAGSSLEVMRAQARAHGAPGLPAALEVTVAIELCKAVGALHRVVKQAQPSLHASHVLLTPDGQVKWAVSGACTQPSPGDLRLDMRAVGQLLADGVAEPDAALQSTLSVCLLADIDQRYQSPEELLLLLQAWLASQPPLSFAEVSQWLRSGQVSPALARWIDPSAVAHTEVHDAASPAALLDSLPMAVSSPPAKIAAPVQLPVSAEADDELLIAPRSRRWPVFVALGAFSVGAVTLLALTTREPATLPEYERVKDPAPLVEAAPAQAAAEPTPVAVPEEPAAPAVIREVDGPGTYPLTADYTVPFGGQQGLEVAAPKDGPWGLSLSADAAKARVFATFFSATGKVLSTTLVGAKDVVWAPAPASSARVFYLQQTGVFSRQHFGLLVKTRKSSKLQANIVTELAIDSTDHSLTIRLAPKTAYHLTVSGLDVIVMLKAEGNHHSASANTSSFALAPARTQMLVKAGTSVDFSGAFSAVVTVPASVLSEAGAKPLGTVSITTATAAQRNALGQARYLSF